MIKVLYAPLNFGTVVQEGVYDAFREAGCQLEIFDYFYYQENEKKQVNEIRKLFIDKAVAFKPDLIHLQIQHTTILDATTIARTKALLPNTIIVQWTGDVRNYVPETYKQMAAVCDYNLISSTGQLQMFSDAIYKPVKYWQIGYNPAFYHPAYPSPTTFEYDVCFIANNNTIENYPGRAERERVCRLLRKHFGSRFALFGDLWPTDLGSLGSRDQKTVASLYHKSFCVLSVSHFNDISHYFSDRLLMCLASGRPTVCYRFPNWQSYFTNNCDIVICDELDEIPNKIKWLMNNPDLASYIGMNGANTAFSEHCYLNRINHLLEMVGLR